MIFPAWDVNEDARINAADVGLIDAALGESGDGIGNLRTDVNRDGTVDATDTQLVIDNLDVAIAEISDAALARRDSSGA